MDAARILTDRLVTRPTDPEVGRIANDLLREFWNGHPLSALRKLLHDPDEDVFKHALFILSELGHKGRPLVDELPRLLSHPLAHARFEAVESAMTITEATEADAPVTAQALKLLDDPHKGVRSVTRHFLLVASDAKLRLALSHLEKTDPDAANTTGLRWLLGQGSWIAKEVIAGLADESRIKRYYAIAAATRMAGNNRAALDAAHVSDDAEVREAAEQAENILRLLDRIKRRMQKKGSGG